MASTQTTTAPDPTPQLLVDPPPMSVGYKIGEVKKAIHMISTDSDSDSTMQTRALDSIIAYCDAEKKRIIADADAAANQALQNV